MARAPPPRSRGDFAELGNALDSRLRHYIQMGIVPMKAIQFLGDSLECLRAFPVAARQDAGYQLDRIQRGLEPRDFTSMPSVGQGVEELRVRDRSGVYRVIYLARLPQALFVLDAFQKKTRSTARRDIEIARHRFADLMRMQR
jgi:phage-related protein